MFQFSRKTQILIVMAVAILVYIPILGNGLVIDDNMFLRDWPGVRTIDVAAAFRGDVPEIHRGVYRPLRTLVQQVYWQLWQTNPLGYHVHSIAVMAASAVLVYLIAEQIFNFQFSIFNQFSKSKFSNDAPFIAGLLFAAHPIHTEAIAYFSASAEMTGAVLYLLSFYLFLRQNYFGAILAYVPAVFTYEMTLTLPLVMLLYDVLFETAARMKKKWPVYLGVAVTVIGYLGVRIGLLGITTRGAYLAYSFYHTQLVMVQVFVRYLWLLVWPWDISYLHELAPGFESFSTYYSRMDSILDQSVFDPKVIVSILIICVILFAAVKVRKKLPLISFSILWFFLTLLPVAYIFPQGIAIAEKYLFLASVGWAVVIAYAITKLKIKNEKLKIVAVALLLLFYGGLTVKRTFDWRNEVVFWRTLTVQHPGSALAHFTLGVHLGEKGSIDEAKAMYEQAIGLEPRMVEARFNLGNIYAKEGKQAEAMEQYLTILELDPNFEPAKKKVKN